jgi:simple sugar transport system permease protein
MRIELVKRPQQSRLFSALSPFIALALTLIAGAIMFSLLGKNPLDALYYYFIDPLRETWSLHELAIKATPLIMIAVGLSVCYQSNNWNIGAEGQLIMGAIAGSLIPIVLPGFQNALTLPLMLVFGMLGGALYAGVPALLKTRFNTNEILTSLMLVYIAQLFVDWLARGVLRDPQGNNFPGSVRFPPAARVPEIDPSAGGAHWGFVLALIIAVAVWFMLSRTMKGFEVRVLGGSPRAGRFAGFSSSRMVFFAFLLSGALAGLAGIIEVAGPTGQLREVVSPGYGFTAIIVAFLGRLNPLGIIAAGLILALTYLGGEAAQISLGLSDKAARVFQGMLLFFVLGCDTLIHYRIRFVGFGAAKAAQGA